MKNKKLEVRLPSYDVGSGSSLWMYRLDFALFRTHTDDTPRDRHSCKGLIDSHRSEVAQEPE